MVTLALASNSDTRDVITIADVTNLGDFIVGTAGYGQLLRAHRISDAANYSAVIGNVDTTNGLALLVQYGDPSGSPTILAAFNKTQVLTNLPLTVKQVDLTNPASGYTRLGARASDGLPVFRASGGAQTLLAAASDSPSTILTTTGSLIYASSGGVAAERLIGSTNQVLTVSGGLPTWANGSKATLGTTGALLYASSANVLASLAIGTTNFMLSVVGGIPSWVASPTSVLTTQSDLLYASSANTLARLAKGTAFQALTMNSGATAPQWSASPNSLAAAAGDIFYASAANTLAKLALGTAGQALTVNAGATAPQWSTNVVTRNQVSHAIGSTSAPTQLTSTYAVIDQMTITLTTTGGDLLVWFVGSFVNSTVNSTNTFGIRLDAATAVFEVLWGEATANLVFPVTLVGRFTGVSAASHTVDIVWKTDSATLTAHTTRRTLMVMES